MFPRIRIPRIQNLTKEKVDNPNKKYPFAHEAITTGIREATITGNPYPIKGWFVYATNLIQALPNEEMKQSGNSKFRFDGCG